MQSGRSVAAHPKLPRRQSVYALHRSRARAQCGCSASPRWNRMAAASLWRARPEESDRSQTCQLTPDNSRLVMAHEAAAVSKVRLYLEAKGLVDRDTFSKVRFPAHSGLAKSNLSLDI